MSGKPLETCRALTVIESIIQRCILLIMLKNTLTMHGPMNVKLLRNVILKDWTVDKVHKLRSSRRHVPPSHGGAGTHSVPLGNESASLSIRFLAVEGKRYLHLQGSKVPRRRE